MRIDITKSFVRSSDLMESLLYFAWASCTPVRRYLLESQYFRKFHSKSWGKTRDTWTLIRVALSVEVQALEIEVQE